MTGRRAALTGAALWLLMPAPSSPADTDLISRAEAGDVEAQFELGRRYTTGANGTGRDPVQAARWFQEAAEQGHSRAQANLAVIYAEGRGVGRDDVEAVNWLVRAADQSHPRAMFLLGERFEKGDGVPQSRAIAHMWLARAAAAGSPAAQHRVRELARLLDADEKAASRRLDALQRARQLRNTRPEPDAVTP